MRLKFCADSKKSMEEWLTICRTVVQNKKYHYQKSPQVKDKLHQQDAKLVSATQKVITVIEDEKSKVPSNLHAKEKCITKEEFIESLTDFMNTGLKSTSFFDSFIDSILHSLMSIQTGPSSATVVDSAQRMRLKVVYCYMK